MNHLATYDRIAHSDVATEIGFNEEVVRLTLQLKETETLQAPENQGIIEKFVNKKLTDTMQRYTYIRMVDLEHFKQILVK